MPKSFHNPHEYDAEYILIPGGRYKYSVTGRTESVPDMYFAKYPVTNKRYRRFIRYLDKQEPELQNILPAGRFCDLFDDYLGSNVAQWAKTLRSGLDEDGRFGGDDQPVVAVSWFAARAYCLWLTELTRAGANSSASQAIGVFRLPKEVEWEWAASGGTRKYPWGDRKPNEELANYGAAVVPTTPVGSYPDGATPEGLMDMAGNAWEWMENRYVEDEDVRSLRGGSWLSNDYVLRCSLRLSNYPDYRFRFIGFRVIRSQS
jgi:formylglycine-generating enzyme required for sulfatase activity